MATGESPLHLAVRQNRAEDVQRLLEARADLEEREKTFGWSALHVAAGNGCKQAARLLLDRGARIDVRATSDGETPLHLAAAEGHTQILRLLLAHEKADPNCTNDDGETPLHVAVQHVGGKPGLGHITALLEMKADPNLKDGSGHDAFDTAGVYTNRAEEVREVLRGQLPKRDPDDPWPDTAGELPDDTDPVEVAEAIRLAGNERFRRGEVEGALKLYLKAKHFLPAELAVPAEHSGDEDEVSCRARKCYVAVASNAAACELKLGRHEACVSRCNSILQLDSSNVKALYRKAVALRGLGDAAEESSESVLLRAAEIDPKDTAIQKELADIAKQQRKEKDVEKRIARKMFG